MNMFKDSFLFKVKPGNIPSGLSMIFNRSAVFSLNGSDRSSPPSSFAVAGLLPGESTCHGTSEDVSSISSHHKQEEMSPWFLSKKEIEDNSPSRRDGISLKRENYLRKSYCIFLRDLGQRLKVPQMTIATAILFCHRFFLRNSHSKNDRMIIATVCMFLAGKVEETPRPLQDVILVSYEIAFQKDPEAAERIKQKEVYEQRKEIILIGEKLVLDTLRFDLTVGHPYKPLIEVTKKLKITQNYVPKIAWNFVNDGLMTTLSLQFKPCQIAAGAIFLAAKFLKVKLPSENLLQELHVNPRQLEEISNQLLDLYYPRKEPLPHGSEVEAGSVGVSFHLSPSKMAATNENINNEKQVGEAENKDQKCDGPPDPESNLDLPDMSGPGTEHGEEDKGKSVSRNETDIAEELGNDFVSRESGDIVGPNSVRRETSRGSIEIDGGEVQGELEKTKKVHTKMTRENDETTEDDPDQDGFRENVRLLAECDQDKMCCSKTDEEDFDQTGMEKADNRDGNKEDIVGNGRR